MKPRHAGWALLALPALSVAIAAEGGHAVYRSTDRGRSWAPADRGIPDGARVNAFGSFEEIVLAGTDSEICLSRDEGRHWRPTAQSVRVLSFATRARRVYAGTERNGLLMSSDKGVTWTVDTDFPALKIRSLAVDGQRLYAGTDSDGVLVSETEGGRWRQLGNGLPPRAQVFALAMLQGRLFAGLYRQGLFGWSDAAQRWSRAGKVSPLVLASSEGTLIAGHNPGGLLWSRDFGATWSQGLPDASATLPVGAPVWELGSGDGLLVAGAADGIYYSEDRGRTWRRAVAGLPAERPGVAFIVRKGLILAGIGRNRRQPQGVARGWQNTRGRPQAVQVPISSR